MNLSGIGSDKHTVQVSFSHSIVNLSFVGFETEIDMDEMISINYSNLYAELITISPLMNRVGIWRADAESAYDDWKLNCSIYEAQLGERLIKELKTTTQSGGVKYPADERVKRCITMDDGVILKRKKLVRLKKEFQYMDSFYWALKEKAGKLNRISESLSLSPEHFEQGIIEGKINGYFLQKTKNSSIT